MHRDQLTFDDSAVAALVAGQFPRWAHLPLRRIPSEGTVNAIYRLGDDLTVRLPLRAEDPDTVRRWLIAEAAAASELARVCPFPTPEPVALGEPGDGYPLPWAVQTWVPGEVAAVDDPSSSESFADDLVRLITSLRAADTRGRRFAGAGRGGRIRDHEGWVEECLHRSEDLLDVARLRDLWTSLRDLPRPTHDAMCHGDLVPGNVIVREGRLAGVLDGGGFAPADPALDLVAAWHLLAAGPRQRLRERLVTDDLEWSRGRAWAFEQAIGLVWYYAGSNPGVAATGRLTLDRLLDDS